MNGFEDDEIVFKCSPLFPLQTWAVFRCQLAPKNLSNSQHETPLEHDDDHDDHDHDGNDLDMGVSKIAVPQNGWFITKNLLKLMIWGVPLFSNSQIYSCFE